ncbi:hypothetical protein ACU82A_25955 [Bacillus cereus]
MDLKVYQVYEDVDYEGRELELKNYLVQTGFFEGDHGLRYLINNDVELESGVLTGSISEEYIPNSFGVEDDKSITRMDDIEPYERTFFAYDFSTKAFLVQNRRYAPVNLTPGKTVTRLTEIFSDAFNEVFNSSFNVIPVLLPEGNNLFINLFESHRVVELKVTHLSERGFLSEDLELSDDQQESENMKRIWNEDESRLDMIHLKTAPDGDLNDNILAFAIINSPNAIIEKIKYYDPEEEGFVTKTRSSF